jgi:hypothetical protein
LAETLSYEDFVTEFKNKFLFEPATVELAMKLGDLVIQFILSEDLRRNNGNCDSEG